MHVHVYNLEKGTLTHIILGIGIQSQPIVVIKFCWYINNVFSYHNKEQWEDACSCKNTAKQLVQDKNTFGIAVKT